MGRLLEGFYGACMLGLWGIRGVTELARKKGQICVLFGYIEMSDVKEIKFAN